MDVFSGVGGMNDPPDRRWQVQIKGTTRAIKHTSGGWERAAPGR